MLTNAAISGEKNVVTKEAENIPKYKDLTIEIQRMWKVKAKSDTSNKRDDWNNLHIIQIISEQHIGKARNQGIKKKPIGHCIHISERADVEVQNI
jgi:hypothetical protein